MQNPLVQPSQPSEPSDEAASASELGLGSYLASIPSASLPIDFGGQLVVFAIGERLFVRADSRAHALAKAHLSEELDRAGIDFDQAAPVAHGMVSIFEGTPNVLRVQLPGGNTNNMNLRIAKMIQEADPSSTVELTE